MLSLHIETTSGNKLYRMSGGSFKYIRNWYIKAMCTVLVAAVYGIIISTSLQSEAVPPVKLSARDIMAEYHNQRSSRDERSKLTMKLVDSQRRERTRKLRQVTITDDDGDQKMIITVEEPEDIRGTAFLIIEHKESKNDQWMYLPAFRRVRRVLPNEKSDSFLGSDFSYEDLETEDIDNHSYRLMGEESLNGNNCWIIEAHPSGPEMQRESGYGKRELWITQDNFVGLQTRFYDKNGKLIKIFRALDVKKIGNDEKWRAFRLEMNNLTSDHQTIILYENFDINQGVPEWIFTRAYLERGE